MVQVFTLGTEEVQINVFVRQECTTKVKKCIGYTHFFKKNDTFFQLTVMNLTPNVA